MNVTIASIFRNSTPYLHLYFEQATALGDALKERGDTLSYCLLEGDSTDATTKTIQWFLENQVGDSKYQLLHHNHGGPVFGSVNNETRWRNISACCNKLLDHIPHDADIVMYVESDIIWDTQVALDLIALVNAGHDAVAPMSMNQDTGLFYDTYGHRKNGVNFTQRHPYHPEFSAVNKHGLLPIDSAGTCIVMKSEVAGTARFTPPERCIAGFGDTIRSLGYTLELAPTLKMYHP